MSGQSVLICYDGSAEARRAIDVAAGLLGPRPAIVLDVAALMTVGQTFAVTASAAGNASFADYNRADARRRAEQGAMHARAAGFTAEARATLSSCTWEGIVDVADEVDAAVIVLGSRGLTAVGEFLHVSVSHGVAEHAGRPVLIVPPARDPEAA
jgi:nucleotide-binding universal stress UspA family protein